MSLEAPIPTELAPYERWWILGSTGLQPVTSCVGIGRVEREAVSGDDRECRRSS
jgi:hypothetical protein